MHEDTFKELLNRGLSIEFIESFQHNLKNEGLEQEQTLKERKKSALEKANRMAYLLKNEYGASSVYLFGSLVGEFFDEYSDIDLYVEGLMGDYWKALIDLEEIALPFKFDLVCAEGATGSLRDKVYKGGVLL